jgi:Protein of unknwon function (DUF3310)
MLKRLDRVPGFRWLYTSYRQYVTGGTFLKTEECPAGEIERYKRGANAMQVGGKHYKKLPIEPWDYIAANGLGFFEGNIIKYVTRAAKTKNRDDLLKAQHYLAKLLEITPIPEDERKSTKSREAPPTDFRLSDEIKAIESYEASTGDKPDVFHSQRG